LEKRRLKIVTLSTKEIPGTRSLFSGKGRPGRSWSVGVGYTWQRGWRKRGNSTPQPIIPLNKKNNKLIEGGEKREGGYWGRIGKGEPGGKKKGFRKEGPGVSEHGTASLRQHRKKAGTGEKGWIGGEKSHQVQVGGSARGRRGGYLINSVQKKKIGEKKPGQD